MPLKNERPRIADLSGLLDGLVKAGVEFILVGGLAAVTQGVPITTMDMDIVHRQTEENINKLFEFLNSIDAYYRRLDEKQITPIKADLAGKGHMLFSTRLGPLDVLTRIEEGRGYDDLFPDSVEIMFRGHAIRVLDLGAMISLKRGSKDQKDRYRLPILEETHRLKR